MEALESLSRQWKLGAGWSAPEWVSDSITVGALTITRVGLASRSESLREVTGSAAEAGGDPTARAFFELLERMGTVEAATQCASLPVIDPSTGAARGRKDAHAAFPKSDDPERWAYSLSNGIAFHVDLQKACDRALWELVERDRLLRSWRGELSLRRTHLPGDQPLAGLEADYDIEAYLVPETNPAAFAANVCVAAVLGFPRRADRPLIHGFGARPQADRAVAAAAKEALQALAFVWEEPLPHQEPVVRPTPQTHLDWYLFPSHHDLLRRWVQGAHLEPVAPPPAPPLAGPPLFVDLTPAWLKGRAWLVKALVPNALRLTFGCGPDSLWGHLPMRARVHPIA